MKILGAVVLAVWIVLVIALNIWHMRRRKKMTPDKRRQHDEALRFDQSVWEA
jgi:uncharacterized iron-regulated membrane protein